MRWLVPLSLLLVGCSAPDGEVVVFAAASMSDGAAAIGEEYQAGHSEAVTVSHGGSDMLAFQISQGAKADVLITADLEAMDIVGKRHEAVAFATSELVVAAGDRVADFDALTKLGVKIAIAAAEVPAGRYTRAALAKLDAREAIFKNVVTEEPNVRSALAKVKLGEVDAAFVYNTDLSVTDLKRIELPEAAKQRATYYIVAFTPAGSDFVAIARSSPGREALAKLGFGKPQ